MILTVLAGWGGVAVGILIGHFLWPRPEVVERKRRHPVIMERKPPVVPMVRDPYPSTRPVRRP